MQETVEISVCIPTYGEKGINDVARCTLPRVEGVEYVVSWQAAQGEIPASLSGRPDVKIFRQEGVGVSANRNNALEHARGEILVIADDDIDYHDDSFNIVRRRYAEEPEMDYALFRCRYTPERNKYPAGERCKIGRRHLPKGYYVTSCELTLRRSVVERGVRFDNRFGINSSLFLAGEETMFVMTMMRRGMKGCLFSDVLCSNKDTTTGIRPIKEIGILKGMGALMWWDYGVMALPRIFIKAMRLRNSRQTGFMFALRGLSLGASWAWLHPQRWE